MYDIRPMGPDQWEAFRQIRLRALAESPSAFGSTLAREEAMSQEQWCQRLSAEPVLASYEGQSPVSIGGLFDDGRVLHIWTMWTAPEARGRGHATAILTALVDRARTYGRPIELDVNLANAGAIGVYERFGFVATGSTGPLREGSAERVQGMRWRSGPQEAHSKATLDDKSGPGT